jgi:hypothetical protein
MTDAALQVRSSPVAGGAATGGARGLFYGPGQEQRHGLMVFFDLGHSGSLEIDPSPFNNPAPDAKLPGATRTSTTTGGLVFVILFARAGLSS